MNEGVGTKIASLVLYFAFGQNDTIPVDLHVIKCATALKWVPPFCKSGDVIQLALQHWVPPHFWSQQTWYWCGMANYLLLWTRLSK